MLEHVTDLLGAYLDGELSVSRERMVEEHVRECHSCRKELAELRTLSAYLQKSVPQESFPPADRFAANLALELNASQPARQAAQQNWAAPQRKSWELLWWAVPFAVMGIFAIIQVYFTLNSLFTSAGQTGLLGDSWAKLQSSPQETLWYSASMSLFGSQVRGSSRAILNFMNDFAIFGSKLFFHLLLQAGFALVYWAWLGLWWNRKRTSAGGRLPRLSSQP